MTSPDPQPTSPRRLTRPDDDRMIAGVASGIGRHFDIDPALVRIGFVVLAVFGGSGLALYAILALLLPSDSRPARIRGDSPNSHKVALGVLLACVIVSLPFTGHTFLFAGPALLIIAVVGALGVLLWRAVGGEGSPTVLRLAIGILALVGAALLGLGAGAATAFGAGTWVAVVVIVTGAALVIGGVAGGARWLIVPAVVMAIPLTVVSAADVDLTGGVGHRDYRPGSMDELRPSYRLGAGEMRLDLRQVKLAAGTTTNLRLHVGAGRIEVTVPRNVCVRTTSHVSAGEVVFFDASNGGIDVRTDRRPAAAGSNPVLFVDADNGVGQIQFDHELTADNWHRRSANPGYQAACGA
jgi:phage shock protein PspC (stress-responsive transcriptional regulator)